MNKITINSNLVRGRLDTIPTEEGGREEDEPQFRTSFSPRRVFPTCVFEKWDKVNERVRVTLRSFKEDAFS